MTHFFTHSHIEFLEIFFDFKRKRKYPLLDVINAVMYVADSGCKWRNLTKEFPPFTVVHYYFQKWAVDGSFDYLKDILVRLAREDAGRNEEPTACIIDSQSVKTDSFVSEDVGYDGNKKIKGRKRHIMVDTQGNLLDAIMGPANEHDGEAAEDLMDYGFSEYTKIELVYADSAYGGRARNYLEMLGKAAEIISRERGQKFVVLPRRWKVEQTISILNCRRRLAKDYEKKPVNSRAWILVSEIFRQFKRLYMKS